MSEPFVDDHSRLVAYLADEHLFPEMRQRLAPVLQQVPAALEGSESPELISDGQINSEVGLLVVTDRRVLFFSEHEPVAARSVAMFGTAPVEAGPIGQLDGNAGIRIPNGHQVTVVSSVGEVAWAAELADGVTELAWRAMEAPGPVRASDGTYRCPFCAEEIRAEAILCRYCGSSLDGDRPGSQPTDVNGLAVASLVLSILWLGALGSSLALILGYAGQAQIDGSDGQQRGRGLAVAGIILGWIGVLVMIGMIFAVGIVYVNRTT